jgi:hypothetical protein
MDGTPPTTSDPRRLRLPLSLAPHQYREIEIAAQRVGLQTDELIAAAAEDVAVSINAAHQRPDRRAHTDPDDETCSPGPNPWEEHAYHLGYDLAQNAPDDPPSETVDEDWHAAIGRLLTLLRGGRKWQVLTWIWQHRPEMIEPLSVIEKLAVAEGALAAFADGTVTYARLPVDWRYGQQAPASQGGDQVDGRQDVIVERSKDISCLDNEVASEDEDETMTEYEHWARFGHTVGERIATDAPIHLAQFEWQWELMTLREHLAHDGAAAILGWLDHHCPQFLQQVPVDWREAFVAGLRGAYVDRKMECQPVVA